MNDLRPETIAHSDVIQAAMVKPAEAEVVEKTNAR